MLTITCQVPDFNETVYFRALTSCFGTDLGNRSECIREPGAGPAQAKGLIPARAGQGGPERRGLIVARSERFDRVNHLVWDAGHGILLKIIQNIFFITNM